MAGINSAMQKNQRIGFVLLPQFSLIAFSAAVEPLRLANRLAGYDVFSYSLYSLDGNSVFASNGVEIGVQSSIADAGRMESIFVCGGLEIEKYAEKGLTGHLRWYSSHGTRIGSLCSGAYVLAKAGLLDGYRCTIHWENIPAFQEEFPDIEVTSELFEMDRTRCTCAGGTAALDMMLAIIGHQFGASLASATADQLIHHRIREGHEGQRMDLRTRLGITHPKLLQVISMMEENIEEPVNCAELAAHVGMSSRQLERLFRKYLNYAPTRYYLELRLSRSRFLLLQTSLSVLSVALACGFISASHFSKCYREYFMRTPSEERRG